MNRLDTIINYIKENKIVADIGTDHGITAIKIYEEKSPKEIIATDISENSLSKLRNKLNYLNYDIKTKVTDGIKDLREIIDDDIDQIIISGMGGFLIKTIIEEGIEIAKKSENLILQANNSNDVLRKFLHDNNFSIIDETICYESGVFYNIIVTKFEKDLRVKKYNNEIEYIYGKINIEKKDDIFKKFLRYEKKRLNLIIDKLEKMDNLNAKNRIKDLRIEIKIIEDILCK